MKCASPRSLDTFSCGGLPTFRHSDIKILSSNNVHVPLLSLRYDPSPTERSPSRQESTHRRLIAQAPSLDR
jgi:hypothetical protein